MKVNGNKGQEMYVDQSVGSRVDAMDLSNLNPHHQKNPYR